MRIGSAGIHPGNSEANSFGCEGCIAKLLLLKLQWQPQRVTVELDGTLEIADEDVDVPELKCHGSLLSLGSWTDPMRRPRTTHLRTHYATRAASRGNDLVRRRCREEGLVGRNMAALDPLPLRSAT